MNLSEEKTPGPYREIIVCKIDIMQIKLTSIAIVKNSRTKPTDDFWEDIISEIELAEHIPTEAFNNIADFSHLEIIYFFDKLESENIVFSGRPRGNPNYPPVGIFAQRKKDRPNAIGLCTVELLEHIGRTIKVKYLDAINGTPILDIKPVFKEFQPKGKIRQPEWVGDLMKNYWK
jgi:tRNA-Thr(GGU) m(6)t(6)A37 methyltransferase TsaA